MQPRAFFPLVCLALAGSATAQSVFYLPKGWEKPQGAVADSSYFGASSSLMPVHVQHMYPTADLPAASVRLQQVAYRRNNWYGNSMFASTQDLTLALSHATSTPDAASSTFASNEGVDRTVVFDGTVSWPAAPYSGPNPAPFVLVIKLTTPFVADQSKGKSLTFDYRIKTRDHKDASNFQLGLYLDAAGLDGGKVGFNGGSQSTCKFSNGKYPTFLLTNTGGLTNAGGTWYVTYDGMLPNSTGAMVLSSYGLSNKGNWPLPIDMTAAGAPGCAWRVGLESGIWLPIKTDASGYSSMANVTIPPGLGGVKFYDQGLVLDAKANALGAALTLSVEWSIGSGRQPTAATVYALRDSANAATGSVRANYALILEGTY